MGARRSLAAAQECHATVVAGRMQTFKKKARLRREHFLDSSPMAQWRRRYKAGDNAHCRTNRKKRPAIDVKKDQVVTMSNGDWHDGRPPWWKAKPGILDRTPFRVARELAVAPKSVSFGAAKNLVMVRKVVAALTVKPGTSPNALQDCAVMEKLIVL